MCLKFACHYIQQYGEEELSNYFKNRTAKHFPQHTYTDTFIPLPLASGKITAHLARCCRNTRHQHHPTSSLHCKLLKVCLWWARLPLKLLRILARMFHKYYIRLLMAYRKCRTFCGCATYPCRCNCRRTLVGQYVKYTSKC